MPGVGGTLQTSAKQDLTVVPPSVVTAFNEGLFLAGTVAKLGAPIGQGATIPFLQNREINFGAFNLDLNMLTASRARFNNPGIGTMLQMTLAAADFSTGLDVQGNDNQQLFLFNGRNINVGNSAQALWQLLNDSGARLYGGVGSSIDSDYPDTGFLGASLDMAFDTETPGSQYGFRFAGIEMLTITEPTLDFHNALNNVLLVESRNTSAGAAAQSIVAAVNDIGASAQLRMHSSGNAAPLNSCAWFGSVGAVRMRLGPIDASGPLDFVQGGTRYARLLTTGEFMVARDISSSALYRLQVGDGTITRGALFNPSNALAISARNVGGGNVYFGARTNGANPDAVITNNLFTEILTITDGGAIQTVAPTGGVSAAGQWQLGSVVAAVVVTDLANYVEINIGGTLRKLQLCN